MFVLYLDIGNSRIKWAYRQQQAWVSGCCDEVQFFSLEWPEQPARVVVSCVRDRALLQQRLQQHYGDNLIWLSTPVSGYPQFHHCYADHSRLGVDRWLAMLGARRQHSGNLLVADAGTALTLDLLSEDHHHLGGWIVPGLALAQQSLFQQTQRVNPFGGESDTDSLQPGRSTRACVASGAHRQLLSLVQSVQCDYPDFALFVCGGDGEWLSLALRQAGQFSSRHSIISYQPHLIFEGMESLCAGSFLP